MLINLKVKTLDAQTHEFSIDDETTVREFKAKIQEKTNITAEQQRIIYCGRVLPDEKQLKEYDVNGKVIHVAERPPPSQQVALSSSSSSSSSTGPRAFISMMGDRRHRGRVSTTGMRNSPLFRALDGMVVGTMAIPLNSNNNGRPTTVNPFSASSSFCMNRITVARHMLQCADNIAAYLENPSRGLNNTSLDILANGRWTMESTLVEVGIASEIPQTQNIVDMVQGAVSAALRRSGNANVTVVQMPNTNVGDNLTTTARVLIQNITEDEENSGAITNNSNQTSTISDSGVPSDHVEVEIIEDGNHNDNDNGDGTDHNENDIANVDVDIDAIDEDNNGNDEVNTINSSAVDNEITLTPDVVNVNASTNDNNNDNDANDTNDANTNNDNGNTAPIRTRVTVLAEVIQQMRDVQNRLNPYIDRFYNFLANDTPLNQNDSNARAEYQRLFDRVSEAFHYMAHAQHAISDLMLNVGQTPPRYLTCRPILVDQSGFVSSNTFSQGFLPPSLRQYLVPQQRQQRQQRQQNQHRQTSQSQPQVPPRTYGRGRYVWRPNPSHAPTNNLTTSNASNATNTTTNRSNANTSATTGSNRHAAFEDPVDEPLVIPPLISIRAGSLPNNQEANANNGNPQNPIFLRSVSGPGFPSGGFHVRFDGVTGVEIAADGSQRRFVATPGEATSTITNVVNTTTTASGTGTTGTGSGTETEIGGGGASDCASSAITAVSTTQNINTTSPSPSSLPSTPNANVNNDINNQARVTTATLPTTSTQTRSTARPQIGNIPIAINMPSGWSSGHAPIFYNNNNDGLSTFDRFLPCYSHHIRVPESNTANGSNASTPTSAAVSNTNNGNTRTRQARIANNIDPVGVAVIGNYSYIYNNNNNNSGNRGNNNNNNSGNNRTANTGRSTRNPRHFLRDLIANMAAENGAPIAVTATTTTAPPVRIIHEQSQESGNRVPTAATTATATTTAAVTATATATASESSDSAANSDTQSITKNATLKNVNDNDENNDAEANDNDCLNMTTNDSNNTTTITPNLHTQLVNFFNDRIFEGKPINEETIQPVINRAIQWFASILIFLPRFEKPEYDSRLSLFNIVRSTLPVIIDLIKNEQQTDDLSEFEQKLRNICEQLRKRLYSVLYVCIGRDNVQVYWGQLMRLLLVRFKRIFAGEALRFLYIYLNPIVPTNRDEADAQQFVVQRYNGTQQQQQQGQQQHQEQHDINNITESFVTPPDICQLQAMDSIEAMDPMDTMDIDMDIDMIDEEEATVSSISEAEEPLRTIVPGSESWHRDLPHDWLPLISRDMERQNSENAQSPFSDVYISGMSAKRRKLIQNSKPPSNIGGLIEASIRKSIEKAGLNQASPSATSAQIPQMPTIDDISQSLSNDTAIQNSCIEMVRNTVRERLKADTDYNSDTYPQTAKLIKK